MGLYEDTPAMAAFCWPVEVVLSEVDRSVEDVGSSTLLRGGRTGGPEGGLKGSVACEEGVRGEGG